MGTTDLNKPCLTNHWTTESNTPFCAVIFWYKQINWSFSSTVFGPGLGHFLLNFQGIEMGYLKELCPWIRQRWVIGFFSETYSLKNVVCLFLLW